VNALARALTVAVVGVEGQLVSVEAHIAGGLPAFVLVGLPDTALSESRDRVRAAVVNSGHPWPGRRITVSLSPASLPKAGAHFDLAVAAAVLAAAGSVPSDRLAGAALLGELGLDGRVRPVRGVLPAVLAAAAAGVERVVVPHANAAEARLVPDVPVLAVRSLRQLVAWLCGQPCPEEDDDEGAAVPAILGRGGPRAGAERVDLADVLGQSEGRFALEVCAAGGHNLFLLGKPGTGKTMLAERLPGLLPPLGRMAALEVTAIHSVAGVLPPGGPLVRRPPFQDPHHTASPVAIIGGGSAYPRPGAASLAHRGILFLDEVPEFSRPVLDALRQPLESGEVVVSRAAGTARYPARFQLVAAANPCPCGVGVGGATGGSGAETLPCRCTPNARVRYLGKLSGPLLDRVDVRVEMAAPDRATLLADRAFVESTAVVADRVAGARARAEARLRGTPWGVNAEVPGPLLRRRWLPAPAALRTLDRHLRQGTLSARGVDRVLRVAWTLADLDGRDRPDARHVNIATSLRIAA
jgi:magnesium chelatase family protein